MSGGLAPSKSTVYVSNLPFSLTNNDLHKVFEKYGKVVKVTILKDNATRRSKGVAFVLYLERDCAHKAVRALANTQMFGRTIKCSIAQDNGRASEFIRRKEYKDKSRCYECGEEGHLSYKCPSNILGERPPPKKKEKKKRKKEEEEEAAASYWADSESSESEKGEDPSEDSLASAIKYQQERKEEEEYRYKVVTGDYTTKSNTESQPKKKFKKDEYFSDEEEFDEDT